MSQALGVEEETKVHTAIGGAEVVKRNFLEIERRLQAVIDLTRETFKTGDVNSTSLARVAYGKTLEEFTEWSVKNGYTPFPGEPLWFSDKDGYRWEWYPGEPNILILLNT